MYNLTSPCCDRTGQEKSLQELIQPDEGISVYIGLSPEDIQACFLQIETKLSDLILPEVRKRLVVARELGAYGYFQWDFFTVSLFWSLTAIEMALRHKFHQIKPPPYVLCKRGKTQTENKSIWQVEKMLQQGWRIQGVSDFFNGSFRSYIHWAVEDKLIPTNIPIHLQEIQILFNNTKAEEGRRYSNAEILTEAIPDLRNQLAHPTAFNWKLIPRSAIDGYRQAVEIINALWSKK